MMIALCMRDEMIIATISDVFISKIAYGTTVCITEPNAISQMTISRIFDANFVKV